MRGVVAWLVACALLVSPAWAKVIKTVEGTISVATGKQNVYYSILSDGDDGIAISGDNAFASDSDDWIKCDVRKYDAAAVFITVEKTAGPDTLNYDFRRLYIGPALDDTVPDPTATGSGARALWASVGAVPSGAFVDPPSGQFFKDGMVNNDKTFVHVSFFTVDDADDIGAIDQIALIPRFRIDTGTTVSGTNTWKITIKFLGKSR